MIQKLRSIIQALGLIPQLIAFSFRDPKPGASTVLLCYRLDAKMWRYLTSEALKGFAFTDAKQILNSALSLLARVAPDVADGATVMLINEGREYIRELDLNKLLPKEVITKLTVIQGGCNTSKDGK